MTGMRAQGVARTLAVWFPIALCTSVALFGWITYRAVRDSENSSTLLAEHTAREAARVLADALMRDMRAVQTTILPSNDWDQFSSEHPYRVSRLVASTFARYPYPAVFFAWRAPSPPAAVVFWTRTDRPPTWAPPSRTIDAFSTARLTEPGLGESVLDRVKADAGNSQSYSVFDLRVGEDVYQVVARLRYEDPYRERLIAVVGFFVDLAWIRQHYFTSMMTEVAGVVRWDSSVDLAVRDEYGNIVTKSSHHGDDGLAADRPFPIAFFDPMSVPSVPPADFTHVKWTAQAAIRRESSVIASGAASTLLLVSILFSTVLLGIGFVFSARAVREHASLAEVRSTFVATVTHELKTPVAAIRAAGDTLASGRVMNSETRHDYAVMVVNEAKRLNRLLNNLLAYARITEVTDLYSLQSVDLRHIIDATLRESRSRLNIGGYKVCIDIEPDLPDVRGDRTALALMFDNIFDNAIRYSSDNRVLDITARSSEDVVTLEVINRGIGISQTEIRHVTAKFFRGRNASSDGSGLGLAIADRIIADHRGTLTIESTVGVGTTVRVCLPAKGPTYEVPDPRRRRRHGVEEDPSRQP